MKIFEQFGINPLILLAQIVNFAILLFLLKRFLYKPILKILEERKEKVATSLKNAEEIEKRLESTKAEQEAILDKARSEASAFLNETKKEAKELSETMLTETKKSVSEMLEKTQKQIRAEKEQMIIEAKSDLADLVIRAASTVTKKNMDQETNRKMVKETLEELR